MKHSLPPVPVALIGVSGYGGTHLRALEALQARGEIRISAATIINQSDEPEKCARLRSAGCRIYEDYRVMLAEEAGRIELCCIPTGIPWHCEMTTAALAARCHVLVEKPAAGSVQEVDEMIRARNAADRQVAVGFQHLYLDEFHTLKSRLAAGELGRLREIRVRVSWPRSTAYYSRNEWAGRLRAGNRWVLDSPANNACAHFLMAALYLSGPELLVAANPERIEAELYRIQDIDSFDTIAARIATDSGISIFFTATHSSPVPLNPVLQVVGDHASLFLEFEKGMTVRSGRNMWPEAERDARTEMIPRILAQIRGLEAEACPLEEARKHTLLINTLHGAIPIHGVSSDVLEHCETPKGLQRVISGINDTLRHAFESGRLFSEMDVPWASAPAVVPVRAMHEFSGPFSLDVASAGTTPLEATVLNS